MAAIEPQASLQVEIETLKRQLDQMAVEKLHAEQKLAALESNLKKFETIARSSGEAIWVVMDGKIAFTNPLAQKILDRTEAELKSLPVSELVFPEDAESLNRQISPTDEGNKEPATITVRLYDRNGAVRRVEIHSVSTVWDGQPSCLGFLSDTTQFKQADFNDMRDISQRKKAEAAQRHSEEELRALVQNLTDVILVIEADSCIKFETPSASRVLGYPPGYLIGKRGLDLVHPEDAEHVRNDLLDVITGKGNLDPTEFRLKSSTGEWLSFEAVADNLLDDPVLQGIVITGRETTARKQAEEEMRSLRDFNERILEYMLEGILVQDRDGYYHFANPAAGRILGYSPGELIGKHWRDIIPEDNYPLVDAAIERRKMGESDSYEVEMRRKDGSRVICWVSGNPLFDPEGYAGAVAVYSDITEFKMTELRNQHLLEQQIYVNRLALSLGNITDLDEIYRTTCELVQALMPVDIFIVNKFNPVQKIMTPGYISVYGEKLDAVGFPKIPFGDEQHLLMRKAVETGLPAYDGNFTLTPSIMKRIDGLLPLIGANHHRLITLILENSHSFLAIPMKVGGAINGVLMALSRQADAYTQEDIDLLTALANMAAIAVQNALYIEAARQQSEEIQQIINTVPDGVLLLNAERTVLLANPAAQVYLHALSGDHIGARISHLGDSSMQELLEIPYNGSWHEITSGKETYQLVARPIERGPARGGWVLVIRDLTQEREVESRIQLQDRLATVGQLAAGIAHDFNNIMSTIVLYAQITAQSPWISNRDRERVSTIHQQAMQATDLIRQILDFSRRSILERQPMSLRPLLKEQVRLFERTLGDDIHIEVTEMSSRGVVFADPTRMQQVMLNLAINARDAMPDGGTLRIGLAEVEVKPGSKPPLPEMAPGKWVRLSVSDTGVGIHPDDLPHIFEPFYTTKAPGEGTGLGLAQVYGIVSQHEGYIDVFSHPGAGATFTVYLPALDEKVAGLGDKDTGPLSRGRDQTILLVEDSVFTRQALQDSLELLNYRVITAANGQEALEVLLQQTDRINLVVSDVIMPEMSGLTLVSEMSDRGMDIPVVLLSGHATGKGTESLPPTSRVQILPKPPSLEQLAEMVNRMLKKDGQKTDAK
jgi:PAS domain S-box-containing protein